MTTFLPGFELDDEQVLDAAEERPTIHPEQLGLREDRAGTAPNISAHTFNMSAHTFSCRVTWFLRSLSPARRREIATRPRFYRLPWVRRADEPDADNLP